MMAVTPPRPFGSEHTHTADVLVRRPLLCDTHSSSNKGYPRKAEFESPHMSSSLRGRSCALDFGA